MSGDESAFWLAAALACVALRQADDATWAEATTAWLGGGRDYAGDGCQVEAVRSVLVQIMGSKPSVGHRPEIRVQDSAGGFACTPTDLQLSPTRGPPGTSVTLSWSGAPWMEYAGAVNFGSNKASGRQLDQYAMIVAAPDGPSGPSQVTMTFKDGQRIDFGTYTYTDD